MLHRNILTALSVDVTMKNSSTCRRFLWSAQMVSDGLFEPAPADGVVFRAATGSMPTPSPTCRNPYASGCCAFSCAAADCPPLWEWPPAGQREIDPQAQPAPDYEFDQHVAW